MLLWLFYLWVGEVALIVGPGLPPGAALAHCSDPLMAPPSHHPPLTRLSPRIISRCQHQLPYHHQTLLLAESQLRLHTCEQCAYCNAYNLICAKIF